MEIFIKFFFSYNKYIAPEESRMLWFSQLYILGNLQRAAFLRHLIFLFLSDIDGAYHVWLGHNVGHLKSHLLKNTG